MSPDAYQHQLGQDAALSGRGDYPEPGPEGFGPDVTGSRLLAAAMVDAAGALAPAASRRSRDQR